MEAAQDEGIAYLLRAPNLIRGYGCLIAELLSRVFVVAAVPLAAFHTVIAGTGFTTTTPDG
ncbi:hypothetical protein SAMN05216355_103114 [Actinomyces ruminicola]|uniref:Uncharacterized protein n=1 Tax=Actinomyces ruminicola TaxID=332524 RepID=A0A1H0B6X0_9ACTO|nr:hypothetical protein [Actinomyces ruminicola]SDN41379.1 hypothetical protein SAMN05216355_103114 [Actinomyces ruminicola]